MNEKISVHIYILCVLLGISIVWNGVQYFTNKRLEDKMGQYILDVGRSREREQRYEEFYRESRNNIDKLRYSLSKQSSGIQHLRDQLLEVRTITEELENSFNGFGQSINSIDRNNSIHDVIDTSITK